MKFGTILVAAAATALFLFDGTFALPTGLQRRDTSSNKVIVGYFPNWLYGRFTPANIDFSKYTHIYYAFAIQNTATAPTWSDTGVFDTYVAYGFPKLVSLAHAAGTKVIVSVGGWSGSTQYSTMASSASNRETWIQWNIDLIKKWDTDGVDIDWEYPTSTGAGCNAVNDNDIANLNSLVKELRAALDANFPNNYKEITMAVHITPFGGKELVSDVSGFVPYVDRFHVMAFDVNGAWNSTSGPNAPFHNTPGWGYPVGFVEGIDSWNKAGVPYNKIAGGIAFYGRAQTLNITSDPETQYSSAISPNPPLGDSLDAPWQDNYCPSDSSVASGVWRWSYMRSQGLLSDPTTAVAPWVRHFDNTTQTPWLYNPTNNQFISYDDPISLSVKTQYALSQDLAGLFVWSADQDNGELLSAIAPMIAGNTERTPITSTKTTEGTASNTTNSKNGCEGYATWDASSVYDSGNLVQYQGNVYKAQWWTQNETPNPDGPSWSAWLFVQAC